MKALTPHPRLWLAGLVVAALVAGAVPAAAVDCPGNVKNAAQVSLTLDPEQGKIVVDPATVKIYTHEGKDRPGRVCWVVQNLAKGQTLHIAGKDGQPDTFPDAERMITLPRTFANSGRPAHTGTWLYEVWITEEGKEGKLLLTDPQIDIDGGGGG